MANMEFFPAHDEQHGGNDYFDVLELQFRDPEAIRRAELIILAEDPELYWALAEASAAQAPGNPALHQFFFIEFLLTAVNEREVARANPTDLFWGSHAA